MKKNILMIITIMLFGFSNAQFGDLLKQAGNKTKEKLENKAKEKVSGNSSKSKSSKEFSEGNTVLFSENFSAGKGFPVSMMTNSSAQIVELDGKNWLQLGSEGAFTFKALIPEKLIKDKVLKDRNLPDNFTFEFDVYTNENFKYNTKELATVFASLKVLKTDFKKWGENRYDGTGVKTGIHPIEFGDKDKGQTRMMLYENGRETSKTEKAQRVFTIEKNVGKVQFMRNGTQLRVFLNGEKIWDVQDAFEENVKYNAIIFTTGEYKDDNKFYISNIKLTTDIIVEPK